MQSCWSFTCTAGTARPKRKHGCEEQRLLCGPAAHWPSTRPSLVSPRASAQIQRVLLQRGSGYPCTEPLMRILTRRIFQNVLFYHFCFLTCVRPVRTSRKGRYFKRRTGHCQYRVVTIVYTQKKGCNMKNISHIRVPSLTQDLPLLLFVPCPSSSGPRNSVEGRPPAVPSRDGLTTPLQNVTS